MKVTFYGHACFEIEVAGKRLLFDPFITPNEQASHINIDSIRPNYILLSHGHEDHIADAEIIARQSAAPIISNYEIVTWYAAKGLKGHPLNHGGKWTFDFGTLHFVNAIHSSMLPDRSYGGNPGGFVISTAEGRFYFAGDTALTMDMKLIPMTCGKLDFAILPLGDNFTMGYEDAIIASDFIECDNIVGCHFDTFGYIEIDHDAVHKAFEARSKSLKLPTIGESFTI